jgi:hypothetical protein
MQIFLNEVSARHPNDRIIMVIDRAGWHCSEALKAPDNIYLWFFINLQGLLTQSSTYGICFSP